jgi:large subunit ribosomal protein L19
MSQIKKINKNEIIASVEAEQIKDNIPYFKSGDTIVLHIIIAEGEKFRIQKFEGVVMKRHGSGLGATVLVRKESNGVNVEQSFYINSPVISKIEVIKHGKVRRAYVSYLRERSGKSARIAERKVNVTQAN